MNGQRGDERLVRKALRACHEHGLGPQANVLCRTAGASAWYAGELHGYREFHMCVEALHACHEHGLGPQVNVLCRTAGASAWYAGELHVFLLYFACKRRCVPATRTT